MRGFGTPCLSVALEEGSCQALPHPAYSTSPIQPIVRNCHQSLAASQHPRPSYHHHTNGKCPLTRFCPHRWLSLVVPRLSHRGRIESGSSSCQAPSPTQHHQFFQREAQTFLSCSDLSSAHRGINPPTFRGTNERCAGKAFSNLTLILTGEGGISSNVPCPLGVLCIPHPLVRAMV